LVVLSQVGDVDDFCEDAVLFGAPRPWRFPAWEGELGDKLTNDETFGDRLKTLKALRAFADSAARGFAPSRPPIIATSIQSLLQPVPEPRTLLGSTRSLQVGQQIAVDELLRWLVDYQFHATSAVEMPGEYSHRGGIVDIFAPDWDQPVRIELFDDEIESLRRFDVASQRSLEALTNVDLTVFRPSAADRAHLSDYLPPDATVLLIEPQLVSDEGRQYVARLENKEAAHEVGEVFAHFAPFGIASAAARAAGGDEMLCHLGLDSVERFSGNFEKLREELDRAGTSGQVLLVSRTPAETRRLGEIFGASKVATEGRLHFVEGTLRTGFRMPAADALVITGAELFQREEIRRPSRRHLSKAIDSFLDLNPGDLVVHLSHGIARYRGLKLIDKNGHVLEHLELEFAEGTKIFVPAAKIDLVQKYIGGTKSRPKLAKIGGQLWTRQKKAAESAVIDMAAELLELQAARQTRPGIAYSSDTDWQRAFDASFPYQETPDQLSALEAIKHDMERTRPMDRLLCGDVGFGKTEVAMRAAFKAVDNGYQVAVLVPTTILAEQHYHTFRERMAEFPFDIRRLSRFCPPQEEREILQRLKAGRVDIAIGTHRLASSDVEFHNLGLVIIDEEQRFGVDVKERLKTLRNTVDILTLSATPIPRTLHMSLVGIRDISNLETAPAERMAVETKVTRFNPDLIRHAVLRELNRGGQIYFVHNRVNDIEVVANKLKQIVPEARMRIGHGQMNEHDLEQVMVDFVAHRFDLLLATTIVESGLDIPNANTIFIDEADRYGLADLHQLRGRVGRYKHHAHCYLLIDPRKYLTPNAAKRLRAIEEFSDMGAGFAISMRDLEIRGAGNLLGSQQSGHISAVGYELYCELLEAAVRDLKKMPPKLVIDVDIDLPGQAFIPDDYLPDIRQKVDLYRRVSRISAIQEVEDLRSELVD
ncbi:MAG TPA: transcription-repair coupling factor, partial [Pirellulaceae bacterium]|nr:transcription-repair coupling factor [Pirellulaceae bacterium]